MKKYSFIELSVSCAMHLRAVQRILFHIMLCFQELLSALNYKLEFTEKQHNYFSIWVIC